jgi:hypothetical protein
MEPQYSQDWFEGTGARAYFEKHLSPLKGKPNLRFLEIGSFEGRSACWLMDNILTGEYCTLYCVDTWTGSKEHSGMDFKKVEATFDANTAGYGPFRLEKLKDDIVTAQFDDCGEQRWLDDMDFIYIDGSHEAADVLRDAVYAWELVKPGGIICFDDYRWKGEISDVDTPRLGIDAFLACYAGRYEIIENGYQLWLRKC